MIYTWAHTGDDPITWSLGILEEIAINSHHLIDIIGCVIRQSDGSWNWYGYDNNKDCVGNAPSRQKAIRQLSIGLNIKGYFTSL